MAIYPDVCALLSHNCLGNYNAEEKFDMLNFQLSKSS